MELITTPTAMQSWARQAAHSGKTIACVPTMGNLHAGHLSLVEYARAAADLVVLTLFVNPTQFGPNEDFEIYPRTPQDDIERCRAAGVDAIFMPDNSAMYTPDASTTVVEASLARHLCGASRPGHFSGVCTVVAKLFNCVLPQLAIFGQKDAQQVAIIKRMVRDLNFPVEIVVAPIVRDPDGLALSSRNRHLSPSERQSALALSRSLKLAQETFQRSPRSKTAPLIAQIRAKLETSGLKVDYVSIVDPDTLEPVPLLVPGALVALAAFAGTTRLIDNTTLV